jgi:hypothetical protein
MRKSVEDPDQIGSGPVLPDPDLDILTGSEYGSGPGSDPKMRKILLALGRILDQVFFRGRIRI